MRLNIDEIVEEVVRRLKIYLSEKRILLVLRDDSDFEEVSGLVSILKEKGYTFHLLSLLSKDLKVLEKEAFNEMLRIRSGVFREEDYAHFMRSYESLLVSDLKMLEVQAYHELYFSETLGKLVFHTIRENKPVYGLSKEMRDVKNGYLKQKMDEIKDELSRLKIHILTEKISNGKNGSEGSEDGRGSGREEQEQDKFSSSQRKYTEKTNHEETELQAIEKNSIKNRGTDSFEGEVLREKFITLSDVMSIRGLSEKETVKIGSQSRLTMEASDYLSRAGVRLLRVEE